VKNNISYYSHCADSDQHAKFKMLRAEFGWAGEGKFWALNNRIAQAENCCLDISKKYNKAAIASDLNFSLEEFEKYITFLIKECELLKECKTDVITTDNIQEIYTKVMDERARARERSERTFPKHRRSADEKETISDEKETISDEKLAKESKVKKSKEKKELVLRKNNGRPPNKICRSIVAYLNKKVGTNYKYKTKSTQGFISARFKEGFTEKNFFAVIDNKAEEWLRDEKMYKYLRPETLFGTKFESYLQKIQKPNPTKPKISTRYIPEENSRGKDSFGKKYTTISI